MLWEKIFFFTVNPLVIWWHVLYIERTINPFYNPRYVLNNSAMQGHFAGLVIMGVFLMIINGATGFTVVKTAHACKHLVGPKLFWVLFSPVVLLYIFGSLLQLVSPFFTPRVAWKIGFKNVCNELDMRVLLDSAPGEPARTVQFSDIKGENGFDMMMDPDPYAVWGFDNRGVYNFTIISQLSNQPWSQINYNLAEGTYTVFSGNTTVTTAEFHTGRHYVMPDLKLNGDTLAFSEACVFDPTLKIFEDKALFMRSVQFSLCSQLQLCALGEVEADGLKVAVPTGLLILMRAGRKKIGCCKGAIIPGIDARGG